MESTKHQMKSGERNVRKAKNYITQKRKINIANSIVLKR